MHSTLISMDNELSRCELWGYAIAIRCDGNTTTTISNNSEYGPTWIRRTWQWLECVFVVFLKAIDRASPGGSMGTNVGDSFHPMANGRVDSVWDGWLSGGKKACANIIYISFDPPFFVGTTRRTGIDLETIVVSKGGVLDIEDGLSTAAPRFYHGSFAVVDHDVLGNSSKIFEGILVSR